MERVVKFKSETRCARDGDIAVTSSQMRVLKSAVSRSLVIAPLIVLFALAATITHSQSGRQKQKPDPNSNSGSNTNTNAKARQVTRSTNSSRSASQQNNSSVSGAPKTTADDSAEVVRVTSNLVPVPTTVLDNRGIAVTNLKLEDFELRVDGQVNTISDISRAETPVRMAMLFDNSGSLSESRDFEKRAAVRFFQNVMRPNDQAAVYSVATNVELAQPMTNDARRLEQTIESFGKPDGATSLYDAI